MSIRFALAAIPATAVTFAIFSVPAMRVASSRDAAASVPVIQVTAANAEPSGSMANQGSESSSAFCQETRERAEVLLPLARACASDSECFHYACSCSALGSNPATGEYLALEDILTGQCGDPMIFYYCGSTRPVCEGGSCSVRNAEDEEEMQLVEAPHLRALERRAAASIEAAFARGVEEDLASLLPANSSL